MKQVTLRLPEGALDGLRRMTEVYGVSIRALIEAAVEFFMTGEHDPDMRPFFLEALSVAKRVDAADRDTQRHRITVRLDDALFARFQRMTRRHDVTLNATIAIFFRRWPDDASPEVSAACEAMLPQWIDRARRLDHQRRRPH